MLELLIEIFWSPKWPDFGSLFHKLGKLLSNCFYVVYQLKAPFLAYVSQKCETYSRIHLLDKIHYRGNVFQDLTKGVS